MGGNRLLRRQWQINLHHLVSKVGAMHRKVVAVVAGALNSWQRLFCCGALHLYCNVVKSSCMYNVRSWDQSSRTAILRIRSHEQAVAGRCRSISGGAEMHPVLLAHMQLCAPATP